LRTRPAPTFGCVQGGNSHQPDPKFRAPRISRANRALQRACPTQASLALLRYQVRLAWFGKEEGSNTIKRLASVGISVRDADLQVMLWMKNASFPPDPSPFDPVPDEIVAGLDGVRMTVGRTEGGCWTFSWGKREDEYLPDEPNPRMRTDLLILLDLGQIVRTTVARARESLEQRLTEKEVRRKAQAKA